MTGYHMVFDREKLKLGWSRHNLDNSTTIPLTSPPHSRTDAPLPTNQQQSSPNGREVTPAIAGRAPSTTSAASPQEHFWFCSLFLFVSQFFLSLAV
ncbi:hypothetical protein IEQ34_015330 [Dendrobium chrysotoxum]|uniref:Uncharacterized protein n=1 Tax=Dendrobium chrysotoxum TaxID=161865 RepID=A0AAV7GIP7_DENCH|nr:hypothetical protein IEQ34_015330 [Dendrobium chrysotoxum]